MFASASSPSAPLPPHRAGVACLCFPDFPFWTHARRSTRADLLVVQVSGRVHSCSPFLQSLGLRPGDPVDRARGLLAEVELRPRDLARERIAMEELLDALSQRTGRVKHLRNPELPGEWVVLRELDFGELAGLAVELDARGGMAPVLGWAMLAAAAVSQAQAAEVSAAQVPPFLARTPVRLLRAVGFSEYLVDTLALLGLDTLQRCRDLTRRQLEARFGPEGKRLFHFLHPVGAELIPVYRPTSLTAAEAWDEPAREPAPLLPYLSRALDRLLAELGHRGCESISLELTGRGGRAPSRTALLKAPTRDRGLLLRRFEELLLAMLGGGLEVGQLRMTLRGITAPAIRQQDFFKRHLDLGRLRQTERRFPGKLLRVRPAAAPSLFPEENAHYEPLFTQG